MNKNNIFKCDTHDFSTNDIKKYDKHCSELEHEYDVRIDCANKCGKRIHIKVKQKLVPEARRIPRGYVCNDCKKKILSTEEIKEPKGGKPDESL